MNEYIEYIYILTAAVINCFIPKRIQKLSSIILLLAMMLMCGFRAYDVGRDTHNYVAYATSFHVNDYMWGPLYLIFKQIAELFDNTETAFLMVMAILTYIPLMYIVKKESYIPALTVLMFIIPCGIFFNETFNIARQAMAVNYILLAAMAVHHGKIKLGYALVILSFFLHPYTFPFVLFFFIRNIRFTPYVVYWTMGITMLLGIVGTLSSIQLVLNGLAALVSDASSGLVLKLAKYGNGYDIASGFSLIGQLSHMLPMVGLCILGVNNKTQDNIYFKMMVCGSAITNIFVTVIYCERIASTFTIAQLLAVPFIYTTLNRKNRAILILILIFTALLYVYNLKGYAADPLWTKYHSIFN